MNLASGDWGSHRKDSVIRGFDSTPRKTPRLGIRRDLRSLVAFCPLRVAQRVKEVDCIAQWYCCILPLWVIKRWQ